WRVRPTLHQAAGAAHTRTSLACVAAGRNSLVFCAEAAEAKFVAVKLPNYGRLSTERELVVRKCLLREAEVLRLVCSKHLPVLVAHHPEGDFLCREFVVGCSLEDLAKADLVPRERMRLVGALLRCARDLFPRFHERAGQGYAIRDFKPRNLVAAAEDGAVVLIDTGSVRSERNMLSTTRRRHRIGSKAWRYWAPEQLLEDEHLLSRKVDYFALGGCLHLVLFGVPAYENGAPADELMAAYRARHREIAIFLRGAHWVQRPLQDFVLRCLEPGPDERPQSVPVATELAVDL